MDVVVPPKKTKCLGNLDPGNLFYVRRMPLFSM